MKNINVKKDKRDNQANPNIKYVKYLTVFAIVAAVIIISIAIWRTTNNNENEFRKTSTSRPLSNSHSDSDNNLKMEKLIGRWQRQDGGYILEIHSIHDNGQLDASYLNPRYINVSKAEAMPSGNTMEVFIELWDEGYPGSTYRLIYDPAQDVLYGIYSIPVGQQNFDVYFVRMQ